MKRVSGALLLASIDDVLDTECLVQLGGDARNFGRPSAHSLHKFRRRLHPLLNGLGLTARCSELRPFAVLFGGELSEPSQSS